MNIELFIEADSEAEREFVSQVANVRDRGFDAGLSDAEVARVFIVFAEEMVREEFDDGVPDNDCMQDENDEGGECPSCGESIDDVELVGIGEPVEVSPCECRVELERLPKSWVDDVVDMN